MQLQAFSILDTKTGIFHAPFYVPHAGQALRAFSDLVADKQTQISRHPADFTLMHLGTWDDSTGQSTNLLAPVSLATASQFVVQQPNLDFAEDRFVNLGTKPRAAQ